MTEWEAMITQINKLFASHVRDGVAKGAIHPEALSVLPQADGDDGVETDEQIAWLNEQDDFQAQEAARRYEQRMQQEYDQEHKWKELGLSSNRGEL